MLCINCAQLCPSQRRIQSDAQGRKLRSEPPLPLLCSNCGVAVTDAAIRDLYIAKVRQLEQFGLGIDPSPAADPPHS